MYKPGFIVTFTLLVAAGCGSSATGSTGATAHIDLEGNSRFAVVIDEAFEAYERELREASSVTYPSRQAAEEHARRMGHESRIVFHIRQALKSHGMEVADLCTFTAGHPGFADFQKQLRAEQLERLDALADSVANATVDPQIPEDAGQLADLQLGQRNAQRMGGQR